LVAKLKGEFDDYVKNINKKTKRKSKWIV
jgi:hypothetical protein